MRKKYCGQMMLMWKRGEKVVGEREVICYCGKASSAGKPSQVKQGTLQ
jgi:hypothetical protein